MFCALTNFFAEILLKINMNVLFCLLYISFPMILKTGCRLWSRFIEKTWMIRFILYSLYGLCSIKISMIFGSFYSSIHCNLMKKSDYIFPIVFHRRKKVIQGSIARLNNSLKNKSWVSEESEPAVVPCSEFLGFFFLSQGSKMQAQWNRLSDWETQVHRGCFSIIFTQSRVTKSALDAEEMV